LLIVKNPVFGFIDQIALKLSQKIIRKNKKRMKTFVEGTSYETSPLKSKIPSFNPVFYFLFYFLYSQKNPKKEKKSRRNI